jgi:hypothetical protein
MEKVGIFYDKLEFLGQFWIFNRNWVIFLTVWFIFARFGILCQEKSGNPACCTRQLEGAFREK